jgi:hypothetical protein
MWSLGRGSSRVYCGIAETEEGFAVDVFHGDTCIDSFVCTTQGEAVRSAREVQRQYDDSLRTATLDHSIANLVLDAPIASWTGGGCSVVPMGRHD